MMSQEQRSKRTIASMILKNEYLYRVFRKPKEGLSGWWWVADVLAESKAKALESIKKDERYIYKAKELKDD